MRSLVALVLLSIGCGADETSPAAEPCPDLEALSPGMHRLYLQGAGGTANADGRYALLTDRRLVLDGDHFIMNAGAFVEFELPIGAAPIEAATIHIARDDDPGVTAEYARARLRDGAEIPLAAVEDAERGNKGRTPSDLAVDVTGTDATCHDRLLVRLTNLTGGTLGIVVVQPDYLSWIDLTIGTP